MNLLKSPVIITVFTFILLLLLLLFRNNIQNIERFGYFDNLWPSKGTYCESKGLMKSYMPQECIILNDKGEIVKHDKCTNCRCINPRTGFCAECYNNVYTSQCAFDKR